MPVIVLFSLLFITESITTTVISSLNLNPEFYWFEAFCNASSQALVSLLILSFILTLYSQVRPTKRAREWLYLQFGISVFGIELLLTLLLSITQIKQLLPLECSYCKALAFSFISTVAVYTYVFRPNANSITRILNRIEFRYTTSYIFGISLLLALLINIYQAQATRITNDLLDHEAEQLTLIDKALRYRITEAVLDTLALANQPDFIRHLDGDQRSLPDVQLEFQNIVQIKHSYDQIRFIDNTGHEQVRVNKGNLSAEIVKPQDLQNKKGRYYVPETGKLDHGKVYISPLDLNIEHGEIELPHKPITRIATPVKDSHSQLLGLIVINLNAGDLIQHLKDAQTLSQGQIMMLNQDGFWLHDKTSEKLWAFMLNPEGKNTLSETNPELWQTIEKQASGTLKQDDEYFVYHRIRLSDASRIQAFEQLPFAWPEWLLVTRISKEVIVKSSLQHLHLILTLSFILAIVTGLGTLLYTRSQLIRSSAESRVKHLADHDPLTGLYNRRNLIEKLDKALLHARASNEQVAVFYLDLDNFKPINDKLGHEAGDEVLKRVSNRLSQMLRNTDTLARIGGDEFVILIPNPESNKRLEEIATRIITNLKQPIKINGVNCKLGVSIGIALSRNNNESRDQLLKAADMLMLEAKQMGKSCYQFAHIESSYREEETEQV